MQNIIMINIEHSENSVCLMLRYTDMIRLFVPKSKIAASVTPSLFVSGSSSISPQLLSISSSVMSIYGWCSVFTLVILLAQSIRSWRRLETSDGRVGDLICLYKRDGHFAFASAYLSLPHQFGMSSFNVTVFRCSKSSIISIFSFSSFN